MDLFCESQAQKITGRPSRTIHIDRKTESRWQKCNVLCLMGPEERGYRINDEIVFKTTKGGDLAHRLSNSIDIDRITVTFDSE